MLSSISLAVTPKGPGVALARIFSLKTATLVAVYVTANAFVPTPTEASLKLPSRYMRYMTAVSPPVKLCRWARSEA